MGRIAEQAGSWPRPRRPRESWTIPPSPLRRFACASADEINAERLDIAEAVADEALRWARATGDDREVAQASRGKAIAASNLADLRERVDRAASLLTGVGDTLRLADLLTSAAYAALCLGSTRCGAPSSAMRRRAVRYSCRRRPRACSRTRTSLRYR
jgi:hypothetical protein